MTVRDSGNKQAPVAIVLATRNPHKLVEIRQILSDLPVQILSLADFPQVGPIEENGHSFAENALTKARAAFRTTGLLSLADDSGLEVDALGGKPGIFSARYAGAEQDSAANIRKLLKELSDVPLPRRTGRFRCAVAIVGEDLESVVEGVVEGLILPEPRGSDGFGYDPVFVPRGYQKTFAELGAEVKNRISHRAIAFRKAIPIVQEWLHKHRPR